MPKIYLLFLIFTLNVIDCYGQDEVKFPTRGQTCLATRILEEKAGEIYSYLSGVDSSGTDKSYCFLTPGKFALDSFYIPDRGEVFEKSFYGTTDSVDILNQIEEIDRFVKQIHDTLDYTELYIGSDFCRCSPEKTCFTLRWSPVINRLYFCAEVTLGYPVRNPRDYPSVYFFFLTEEDGDIIGQWSILERL